MGDVKTIFNLQDLQIYHQIIFETLSEFERNYSPKTTT